MKKEIDSCKNKYENQSKTLCVSDKSIASTTIYLHAHRKCYNVIKELILLYRNYSIIIENVDMDVP